MILQDGDYPKTDERDRDERLIRALGVLFGRSSEEIEGAVEWVWAKTLEDEEHETGRTVVWSKMDDPSSWKTEAERDKVGV